MGDRGLVTWVNDQLHSLVGYSERQTVDFVLALCMFYSFGLKFLSYFCLRVRASQAVHELVGPLQ